MRNLVRNLSPRLAAIAARASVLLIPAVAATSCSTTDSSFPSAGPNNVIDTCAEKARPTALAFVGNVAGGERELIDQDLAPVARFESLASPLGGSPVTGRDAARRELDRVRANNTWTTGGVLGALAMPGHTEIVDGSEAGVVPVEYGSGGRVIVFVACDLDQIVRIEWESFSP